MTATSRLIRSLRPFVQRHPRLSGVLRNADATVGRWKHSLARAVPLVIRPAGGIPGGRRLTTLVSHVDLPGTVFDLLGIDAAPGTADRISVAGTLAASPALEVVEGREVAFVSGVQRGPTQYALRTRHFKIIHYPGGEQPDEVYDLRVDPGEAFSNPTGTGLPLEAATDLLEAHMATMGRQPETGVMDIDPATRKKLEALGYVDRVDHP